MNLYHWICWAGSKRFDYLTVASSLADARGVLAEHARSHEKDFPLVMGHAATIMTTDPSIHPPGYPVVIWQD